MSCDCRPEPLTDRILRARGVPEIYIARLERDYEQYTGLDGEMVWLDAQRVEECIATYEREEARS